MSSLRPPPIPLRHRVRHRTDTPGEPDPTAESDQGGCFHVAPREDVSHAGSMQQQHHHHHHHQQQQQQQQQQQ